MFWNKACICILKLAWPLCSVWHPLLQGPWNGTGLPATTLAAIPNKLTPISCLHWWTSSPWKLRQHGCFLTEERARVPWKQAYITRENFNLHPLIKDAFVFISPNMEACIDNAIWTQEERKHSEQFHCCKSWNQSNYSLSWESSSWSTVCFYLFPNED